MFEMSGNLSEIRDYFDVESNSSIFYEQIKNEDNDYTGIKTDYFSPLYEEYLNVTANDNLSKDDLNVIINEFTQLCFHIINYISDKFNLDIDSDNLSSKIANIPALTKALYFFFIHQFYNNIVMILQNYIQKNSDSLYSDFSELETNKDVMIEYYRAKKNLNKKYSVIAANIYDISDFIFTKLDASIAMTYCDNSLVAKTIAGLVNDSIINNNFIITIADIYKRTIELRSRVCFDLVFCIVNDDISGTKDTGEDEE